MIENAQRALRRIAPERVLSNEPMDRHVSFRAGGRADLFFMPADAQELAAALQIGREEGLPTYVIGAGTNLVVPGAGVRGLVIALGDCCSAVVRDGTTIRAQAGARLSRIAQEAQTAGLAGLEFAAGIPGSLGGGVAMNAGAYGGELADCVTSAKLLIEGRVETLSGAELEFGYRTSMPLKTGAIVLEAEMALQPDDCGAIAERMRELNRRRREKQPLELPSAGSTFKRPEGYFAGALIEQAGLKGLRVGGAQVSEKHAGFIVNAGGATGDDILDLIALVQKRVFEHSGVRLEREVRVLGGEE
ncbi:MAG: UDP-N-acetylmuramate dehydrogenase [Eubacteriales bacterium]|nr:UDP-N-acetylmuramate dehydrogenase [Eubacteriales bacterium]